LSLKSRTKTSLEILVVHRFAKVANHSILQCPLPDDVFDDCDVSSASVFSSAVFTNCGVSA
jgi:hypothetical protein